MLITRCHFLTASYSMLIIVCNMTNIYNKLLHIRFDYMSTAEAARTLGITHLAASRLVRQGKLPGVKIGGNYMVPRVAMEELAKTYVPRRGRPRTKRKYTKRSAKWEM